MYLELSRRTTSLWLLVTTRVLLLTQSTRLQRPASQSTSPIKLIYASIHMVGITTGLLFLCRFSFQCDCSHRFVYVRVESSLTHAANLSIPSTYISSYPPLCQRQVFISNYLQVGQKELN